MNNLRPEAALLIKDYRRYLEKEAPTDEPKIQVDEIASKVAAFYERIREVIDYQEGHLLRKGVINRALRRRIFLKDIGGDEVAEGLIKEIIRSGHLPNNAIPEARIKEVQEMADLTLGVFRFLPKSKRRNDDEEWLVGVTVCAIEEILAPAGKEVMLAEAAFQTIEANLKITGRDISSEERRVLLFMAIYKSIFKVDDERLGFRLFQFLRPSWQEAARREPEVFAKELSILRSKITRYLKNKKLKYFMKMCNRERAVFRVAGDLVFNAAHLEDFDKAVKSVYEERYAAEKSRLYKLAFLSIFSFFLSKILIAIAIEVPIDNHFSGGVSLPHLAANIVFPPVLMLLIMFSIKLPSENNLVILTTEIRKFFYGPVKEYALVMPKKNTFFMTLARGAYTLISFVLIYYFTKLLFYYGFSTANIVVFLLFTSLVTATGVKVYNRARELSVEKQKATLWLFVLDVITLPLVTLGKWVMSGLKRFNVLVLIFNVVIELPIQLFVEFLESFNDFMKSKKEEVE